MIWDKGNKKYGNKKITVDGIKFDSLAEHRRYQQLRLLETAGEIRHLQFHTRWIIKIENIKICAVIDDFSYEEVATGKLICEDVKGMDTDYSRLKRKMVQASYPNIEWRVIGLKTKPKRKPKSIQQGEVA